METCSTCALVFQRKVSCAHLVKITAMADYRATTVLALFSLLQQNVDLLQQYSDQRGHICQGSMAKVPWNIAAYWRGIVATLFSVVITDPCVHRTLLKMQRKDFSISGNTFV